MHTPDHTDNALFSLLKLLAGKGYSFVTPTPATHARVIARADKQRARDLRDVLGWSLPFEAGSIDGEVEGLLAQAGVLGQEGGLARSRVRVSTLHGHYFLHSAYPTEAEDSVFFGPDSYRFADLIARELERAPLEPGARIVDIGTGAGVGAIVAAGLAPEAQVTGTDVNPKALRLARINAQAAGVCIETVEAADLSGIAPGVDLALANPPYIIDADGPAYRNGGGMHGGEISLDMARMAVERLAPGGRLILYTGSAIVGGRDRLDEALGRLAAERGCTFRYSELDPDVFGEELAKPQYRDVERIAAVAAILIKR